MDWKCPNCDREIAGSGDTCPHCGVRTPRDSWAFKCAWLGKVIASNEHGAFAFNKSTGQLWLATPESAFEINTKELGSDGDIVIARLIKVWGAKCRGDCPLTLESLAAMVKLAEPLLSKSTVSKASSSTAPQNAHTANQAPAPRKTSQEGRRWWEFWK